MCLGLREVKTIFTKCYFSLSFLPYWRLQEWCESNSRWPCWYLSRNWDSDATLYQYRLQTLLPHARSLNKQECPSWSRNKNVSYIKSPPLSAVLTVWSMGTQKSLLLPSKAQWLSRDGICATVWVTSYTSCVFSWSTMFTWRNNSQTMIIQNWVFGSNFINNQWHELVTSRM